MSSKMNIINILKGNFDTFKSENNYVFCKDVFWFYILPAVISLFAAYNHFVIDQTVIGHLINASALLSGLLLNLLILVFGLKEKLPIVKIDDPLYDLVTLKRRIMRELYYNVSSASLVSLFLLVGAILHGVMYAIDAKSTLLPLAIDPLIIFLVLHLLMSFLMIIKRTYKLLLNMQD